MSPEIDIREEGNSVDPPNLQTDNRSYPLTLGGSFVKEGPVLSFHDPNDTTSSDLRNGGTFVYESSTTSSRACFETFSATDGAEQMSTFVLDRDAHTTSISATGRINSLNESNSASASRGQVGVSGQHIHIITKGDIPGFKLNQGSTGRPFEKSDHQYNSVNNINKGMGDISENYEQDGSTYKVTHECKGKREYEKTDKESPEQSSTNFNFEQTKLAYRLKPQLTSDFLSQELSSSTTTPIDIESILRKYGLETKKYNSPLRMLKHAHGDTTETSSKTSTVSSYRSYTSCKFVSISDANNTTSCNKLKHCHTSHMNISQNNEALKKLIEPTSNSMYAEDNSSGKTVCTAQSEQNQHLFKTFNSSSNFGSATSKDFSKNNDVQEMETREEMSKDHPAEQLSAVHGSSVDIEVNNRSEELPGQENSMPLSHDLQYSELGNTTSATAYASPYGGMGSSTGIHTTGVLASSHPSNMDARPFEGSYLKHHLAMSEQPPAKGAAATATPDMVPSGHTATGNSMDSLSSTGSNLKHINGLSSPIDSLDYSLQKERYRLRGIDNLITSSPGRVPRPYSTMPYSSIYSYTNFPITSSNRYNTSMLGNALPSTNSISKQISYGNPTDVVTIRRTGSNVDTGQFNNNRGIPDYGYRANRYSSEIAERLNLKQAWVTEPYERNQNQRSYMTTQPQNNQQKQNQNQDKKKQKMARNTKSSAQNIIERNRLAVSQYATANGKAPVSTRDKKNNQRPKSAQAANNLSRGSDLAYPTNHSHNSVFNGSDFAREIKRIVRASTQQDNKKNQSDVSHTSKCNNARSNITHGCGVNTKCKENNRDKSIKRSCIVKDISVLKKRQSNSCKYQQYLTKTKDEEEKQQYTCQEQLNYIESGSEEAPSRSSSTISRSQESCALESEYDADASQLHSYPNSRKRCNQGIAPLSRCRSTQEISQRSLVAATALASALIHKRELKPDRLKMFLEDTFPGETRKRSARAETNRNTATSESRAMKMQQEARKSLKKTMSSGLKSSCAASCPYADSTSTTKSATPLKRTKFMRQ